MDAEWGIQNILVVSVSPIVVKITDFGISKHFGENTELQTMVGTSGYAAPEIWGHISSDTSVYTSAVDIWSLGCLIYAVIVGKPPFRDPRDLRDYVQSRIRFPRKELIGKGTSLTAIKFISDLMRIWPDDRLTAEQALDSKWLKGDGEDTVGSLSLEPSQEYVQELLGRIRDHEDNTAKLHALENKVEELSLELEETRNESIRLTAKSAVEHKSERGSWTQELDEWRGQTTKLREDLGAERKQHEFDLAAIKRDLSIKEADRQALERDLNGLQQQLAARSGEKGKKSKGNATANSGAHSRWRRGLADDIEFSAEISQGLLVEVRRLQALLAERDETLEITRLEKERLEQEISGSFQRSALDRQELEKFKEENWNLELVNQELRCMVKDQEHGNDQHEASGEDMVPKDPDGQKMHNQKLYEDLEAENKRSEFESAIITRALTTKEAHQMAPEKKVADLEHRPEESHNQGIRLQSVIENRHNANLLQSQLAEHSPSPLPMSNNTGLGSDPFKPNLQDAHQMNDTNILQNETEEVEFDTFPGPAANKQNERDYEVTGTDTTILPPIPRSLPQSVLWVIQRALRTTTPPTETRHGPNQDFTSSP